MTVGGGTAVGSAIIIASSVGVDTVSFGTTLIPSTGAKAIGATGSVSDVATKNNIVPALRYNNPNERGRSYIKFDGIEKNGTYLIDSKTNIPYWNEKAMSTTFIDTLKRINEAKKQNPDIKVICEFPNNAAKEKLIKWIETPGNENYKNTIDMIKIRGEQK